MKKNSEQKTKQVKEPVLNKADVSRRSKPNSGMKSKEEIEKALKDMEVRRSAAVLDMVSKMPNGIKYDTELIRNIESIDVVIHSLKWVLQPSEVNGG